jgi:predicted AlkP superfamily pyrophosphatase or phosphodiesterase
MLPGDVTTARSLADVLASCLGAVHGESNTLRLPRVERAVVVLADGLGSAALRSRSGHARYLSSRLNRASQMNSGFPTTTAAALASLCTGTTPGKHGMVGYRVLDPATDRMFNQLSGWAGGPDPAVWQRSETLFERATGAGIPAFAIGPERYRDSEFSRAILRGSEYVGAKSISDRFDAARAVFDSGGKSLVYLYVPELDMAAHARGWESDTWTHELEALDSSVGRFGEGLRAGEGALVTADHGVLDVPAGSQVLFDQDPSLVAGVRHVGGDPRCLQLYLDDPAGAGAVADRWRESEAHRSWIATRDEAIAAGWFGDSVDTDVAPRIGDVLVAARSRIAYYDSREANQSARSMIGQHGSFSPEELKVPLIGLGDFA